MSKFQSQSGTHVGQTPIILKALKTKLTSETHKRQVGTCDQNQTRLIAFKKFQHSPLHFKKNPEYHNIQNDQDTIPNHQAGQENLNSQEKR